MRSAQVLRRVPLAIRRQASQVRLQLCLKDIGLQSDQDFSESVSVIQSRMLRAIITVVKGRSGDAFAPLPYILNPPPHSANGHHGNYPASSLYGCHLIKTPFLL